MQYNLYTYIYLQYCDIEPRLSTYPCAHTCIVQVVQVALTAEQDQMLDTPTPQPLDGQPMSLVLCVCEKVRYIQTITHTSIFALETPPSSDTPPNSARSTLNRYVVQHGSFFILFIHSYPPSSLPVPSSLSHPPPLSFPHPSLPSSVLCMEQENQM